MQHINETTQIRIEEINTALTHSATSRNNLWLQNIVIGERLYLIKESFDGNTKQFGDYLATHTPKLDVKLVSYYIKLAGHNEDQYEATTIHDWLVDNAIQATNPRSCWDKFNKAHKNPTPADEQNGKPTNTTPETDTKVPSDSLTARLENIILEIRDGVIQGTINDIELARLSDLADKFANLIDELE